MERMETGSQERLETGSGCKKDFKTIPSPNKEGLLNYPPSQ